MKKKLRRKIKRMLFENPLDERLKEFPKETIEVIVGLKPKKLIELNNINERAIKRLEKKLDRL